MPNKQTYYNMQYIILCCITASFGGLLMGYDSSIISGAIEPLSNYFQLTPSKTGWAVSNILLGSLIGCLIAPRLSDTFGRKKSLSITALLFSLSVIGTSLAYDFDIFVIFRIIGGLAIGLASVISPIYLAELSPSKFRGRTTALYAVCCVGGQSVVLLTNYFITKSILPEIMVEIGWRYILVTALLPCILFIFFLVFIPESPRWNILKGQYNEALDTLIKISNYKHAKIVFKEIKYSFLSNKNQNYKSNLSLDKATISLLVIGIGLAVGNQISGINVIQYFGPILLKNISSNMDHALLQTFWLSICQFIGILIGMTLIDKIGRRKLLLLGALASYICLTYSFITFYYHLSGLIAIFGLVSYMIFFGMTWGQVVWTVLSEIFPTKIRSMCMGICICTMSLTNFVISTIFPILNSNTLLIHKFHGGFPLLLFAIFSLFIYLFTFRYLPETTGMSLEKINNVLSNKLNSNT
ncbi:sugar porter family MFS transporter [Pantoea sp. Aalb]|uniref:sugar porter family MFS transporter n=1 Tax=Pantoea sp. Aalb TaxID=2576762 RepID=UPI00132933B0|nr:sugar porter family MFS transporter [Pantoea sp. Aalb]MXP67637.1 sugar porter family MFS transporter [Pantoea sp. Aalb]